MAPEVEAKQSIAQFVKEVINFSSQYGTENGSSYTAANLAGEYEVYPRYCDHTSACVFRTYGRWWKQCPSAMQPIGSSPNDYTSEDFIDLFLDRRVVIEAIEIYETYNPGAVVRILACYSDTSGTQVDSRRTRWITLWKSQEPDGGPIVCEQRARIFRPRLVEVPYATNIIRLELNSTKCAYYTELDAVRVVGLLPRLPDASSRVISGPSPSDQQLLECSIFEPVRATVFRRVEQSPKVDDEERSTSDKLSPTAESPAATRRQTDKRYPKTDNSDTSTVLVPHSFATRLEVVVRQPTAAPALVASDEHQSDAGSDYKQVETTATNQAMDNGLFDKLPSELMLKIMSYLDFRNVCRVAAVSRRFCSIAYQAIADYPEMNLRCYWPRLNDAALDSFQFRSGSRLRRLDISWCGNSDQITPAGFDRFLRHCCSQLATFCLASCKFVNDSCILHIASLCPQLKELDLSSCRSVTSDGFLPLSRLTQLERVNLYRTLVDLHGVSSLVSQCPQLRHVNLGSCSAITDYDEVACLLAKHCSQLQSIDMWRGRTLKGSGLIRLARNCPRLEELDLGWCTSLESDTNCFIELVKNCTRIKKLFLTAIRSVSDEDLEAIALHCPQLEQLDVLGTRIVTSRSVYEVLTRCPRLRMFDVSFCNGLEHGVIQAWRQQFTGCAILTSYAQDAMALAAVSLGQQQPNGGERRVLVGPNGNNRAE